MAWRRTPLAGGGPSSTRLHCAAGEDQGSTVGRHLRCMKPQCPPVVVGCGGLGARGSVRCLGMGLLRLRHSNNEFLDGMIEYAFPPIKSISARPKHGHFSIGKPPANRVPSAFIPRPCRPLVFSPLLNPLPASPTDLDGAFSIVVPPVCGDFNVGPWFG